MYLFTLMGRRHRLITNSGYYFRIGMVRALAAWVIFLAGLANVAAEPVRSCRGPYDAVSQPGGGMAYFFRGSPDSDVPNRGVQNAKRVVVWIQEDGDRDFAEILRQAGHFETVVEKPTSEISAVAPREAGDRFADKDVEVQAAKICRETDTDLVFLSQFLGTTQSSKLFSASGRVSLSANLVTFSCRDDAVAAKDNLAVLIEARVGQPVGGSSLNKPAARLWANEVLARAGVAPTQDNAVSERPPTHVEGDADKFLRRCTKDLQEIAGDFEKWTAEQEARQAKWAEFVAGDLRPYRCTGLCIMTTSQDDFLLERNLFVSQSWQKLAEYLTYTKGLEGYDSRYLHLGYAAEGLGYRDAAIKYYTYAKEIAGSPNDLRSCRNMTQQMTYKQNVCMSHDVMTEAASGIRRIEQEVARQQEDERRRLEAERLVAERAEADEAARNEAVRRQAAVKEEVEQRRKARRASLLKQFPAPWVDMILKGEVAVGWSESAVKESLGQPLKTQTVSPQEKLYEYKRYKLVLVSGEVSYVEVK